MQGCYVAKSETQQMCRSQGSNGQLEGLEQSHGSSLEPLDKHFQSHGLINETRKVSKLENKICQVTISSRPHWHPGFSCIPSSRDMMEINLLAAAITNDDLVGSGWWLHIFYFQRNLMSRSLTPRSTASMRRFLQCLWLDCTAV